MERISNILIPVDFSPQSRIAVRYALQFVGTRPNKHITLCFMQDQEDIPALEAEFESIRGGLSKAFRSSLSWIHFSPPSVDEFVARSKSLNIDLILIGTSGSEDLEGSTKTSQIVLAVNCPVLVIPDGVSEEFQLSKIALVLGPKEIDNPKDLGTLLDVARTFDARVHVLTIENKPGTYGYSKDEEQNENLLEYYLDKLYSHHVYIENEDVVQGVFDYCTDKEIDLIAILPDNHVVKGKPTEGRLTRLLTLQTSTPLLAIEH